MRRAIARAFAILAISWIVGLVAMVPANCSAPSGPWDYGWKSNAAIWLCGHRLEVIAAWLVVLVVAFVAAARKEGHA
ncbi:MAG: hypothetical protein E5299_02244 [Burkholderia gladioli]|nr:MAG: hypothetical protein E5299_02244 [Burkholderia gladioli]